MSCLTPTRKTSLRMLGKGIFPTLGSSCNGQEILLSTENPFLLAHESCSVPQLLPGHPLRPGGSSSSGEEALQGQ